MTFSPTWPHGHQTRDGRKARIICTDRSGERPIIALALWDDTEALITCRSSGAVFVHRENPDDLINSPAPKRKVRVERWMNVYADGSTNVFFDKTQANMHAHEDRIACIHIDREVEEGEGLTP